MLALHMYASAVIRFKQVVWGVQIDGIYVRSLRDWDTFAVRTSQIITGQNAASSKETADAVVDALSFGVRLTP